MMTRPLIRFLFAVVLVCGVAGCVGSVPVTPPPVITVTTSPGSANVRAGSSQQFGDTVTGTSNLLVTWQVNGVTGGNAVIGTVSTTGLYSAPAVLPTPNLVSVEAVSASNPSVQGVSAVTVWNPIPVVLAIAPTSIGVGSFSLTVNGSAFVPGAQVMFGTTALNTTYLSATQLNATGTATTSQVGNVVVTVQNPDPGSVTSTTSQTEQVTNAIVTSAPAAARFLEQSTFGPTSQMITQLQQVGFTKFLNDQFVAPISTYPDPDPTVNSLTPTQQIFITNAVNGPDQLRQRVSFALSEMWVVSGNTVSPQGMAPYMRLLQQDALSNYRTIMQDVTLSPAMGRYLDMVNNDKPDPVANTHANENYAREFMQLFTLGLNMLNQNGSLKLDSSNNPIPTYNQNQVQAFARVFTGWTYPTQSGQTLQKHNPQYYLGPMVAFETNHDTASKTLLQGTTLSAGQTSTLDLAGALDNIFNHPNLPPFVCKQLIQHLVTSNPSAPYVRRVADVFVSGTFQGIGSGQRGDMQAVIAAILLDIEARRGDDPSTADNGDGHLREPILLVTNLLRAFSSTTDGNAPVNFAASMNQSPLRQPSVFNFFPPDFQIAGTTLLGPEFDLQNTATSLVRINFTNTFAFGSLGAGTTTNFSAYATLAANPSQLVDTLNGLLLHGTLSSSARSSILTAVNAVPAGSNQHTLQAETAIYLIISSSQFQIMH